MKRYLFLVAVLSLGLFFSTSCYYPHYAPPDMRVQDSLSQGGTAVDRFAIVGNNLCIVSDSTIKIYNIQNPAIPKHMKDFDIYAKVLSLKPYKDSSLAIGIYSGIRLYNIVNSYLDLSSSFIRGSQEYDPFTYSANYFYFLQSISFSYNSYNPPKELDAYTSTGNGSLVFNSQKNLYLPKDISVDSNSNLFICDSGLKVFDASVVTNINLKKHFNIEANKITAYNDNLFVLGSTGLYQYRYASDTINLLSKINIVPSH